MRLLPKHVGRLVRIKPLTDFGGEYEPSPYGIRDVPNWSDYIDSFEWKRDQEVTYELGSAYGTVIATGHNIEKRIFLRYAKVLIAKQEPPDDDLSFIFNSLVPAGMYWISEDFLELVDEEEADRP